MHAKFVNMNKWLHKQHIYKTRLFQEEIYFSSSFHTSNNITWMNFTIGIYKLLNKE